jgi:hypothetical protein
MDKPQQCLSPQQYLDFISKLLGIASETLHWSKKDVVDRMTKPEFEKKNRVHDWRNYIPDQIKEVWGLLSLDAQLALLLTAEQQASAEDWD